MELIREAGEEGERGTKESENRLEKGRGYVPPVGIRISMINLARETFHVQVYRSRSFHAGLNAVACGRFVLVSASATLSPRVKGYYLLLLRSTFFLYLPL